MKSTKSFLLILSCFLAILLLVGNANAQCKQKVTVTTFPGTSGYYNACDNWLKSSFKFNLTDGGNYAVWIEVENTLFERTYWAIDWDSEDSPIEEWTYCSSKNNHKINTDITTGSPGTDGFSGEAFTASYYASQGQ